MMKGKISFAVVVCLFLVETVFAQTSLKVNETETKAFSTPDGLQINLAIESDLQKNQTAKVHLEILDKTDNILSQNETTEKIERGKSVLPISFRLAENDVKTLLWHRLRYSITVSGISTDGIISLSEIMPELFELRVSASEEIYAGMLYLARVRAFHPTKNTPISDVEIDAELTIDLQTSDDDDNDELIIKARGKTDVEGFAVLEFQIPADVKFSDDYSGEVEIIGTKNGLKGEADDDLRTDESQISVYFMTDKPLYQPNQKIFVRGLAMRKGKSDAGMTVVAEKEFEFSIKDEDDTTLYRQKVTTSRFGIAAIEWQIPANAKLGSYRVIADSDDEDLRTDQAYFKVSRYDLPNFVVQTKAGKDFYLPTQNTAEVTVDGLYLFGKPVTSGKVKVVQESKREWNYREQKWDIQEEATYEGEADADGKYIAKIDLSKAHEELRKADNKKFEDLNFTAYFTDFSTNKTEQKRFDVRVTKEPIHVYLIGKSNDDQNPQLPLNLYVTTFSADGKPLVCDVEIKGKYDDEQDAQIKTFATFKTNSLGAGKVEFSVPKRADDVYYDDLELKIIAKDAENTTGTLNEEIEIDDDEKQIIVRTDKAIYKKGEPLKVEILSSEANQIVFVDVSKNSSSLESRQIKLKNGRAEVKIPYNAEFKSYLSVSAYFEENGDAIHDSQGVFYPTPQNLRVNVETNKEIFRPAEDATMSFNVATPDKKQTEAALGVVILDKAVEERAKTDANFGGNVDIFQNFDGVDGNSWNDLDMKKAVPAEMQLLAEMRFANAPFEPNFFDGDYSKNLESIFAEKIKKQFENVQKVLWKRYQETFEHPTDEVSLRKILSENGINFDDLRDPWGNKYRAYVYVDREYDALYIWSNGANKVYDDDFPNAGKDDFTTLTLKFNYFTPTGLKINEAVNNYVKKTGKFVRDIETLRVALAEKDINFDELKDRWGESYRVEFGVNGRNYTLAFRSSGADKKFNENSYEDFVIWTTQTDYFAETEDKISLVLSKFITDKKTFPKDETELKQILRDGGIDFDALRDGWNRPFYLLFEIKSQFADKIIIENVAKQGETAKETISITPVTRQIAIFHIRSLGADGVKAENNNYGDEWISTFGGIVSEQTKDDGKPKIVVPKAVFTNGKSAIYGIVTDANKAIVANADVTITNSQTQTSIETKTNAEGVYLQTNLAAGRYSVKVSSVGFKSSIVNEIMLGAEIIVEINLTLEVGAVSETVVVVSSGNTTIDTASTKIETTVTQYSIQSLPINGRSFSSLLMISPGIISSSLSGGFQIDGASGSENVFIIDGQEVTNVRNGTLNKNFELVGEKQNSTPRLREYFPETMLWIPELVTDASGKVSIKFRLADNITTWKIYVIASDTRGKIGVTSKEIKAFQPFFVDLDPPRVLTEGDEIFLPVQVRNYTETKQKVNVEMAQSNWFSFLSAGTQTVEVLPNATNNTIFGFKSILPVTDGKQKVTAIAETDSDAIEKPVTVRPNGQEIVRTESKLFRSGTNFEINFPANALPKTPKAELKIYPNLMAHVTESVEGLLQRPYGCGEQTISSTYPNLMILKFTKSDNLLTQKAKKYLQKGYERLLGYQVADGGFSYWGGKDSSDIALTAYALRFLNDAKSQIEVDAKVIENAQNYLIKQQRADGSFTKKYTWETTEDAKRTKLFTSYVVRTLALLKTDKAILDKGLAYLKTRSAEIDEPYALALFGLASLDAGNLTDAKAIAERLEKMALMEGDKVYWNLETNTPFYGWGTAGRIETTALVLQFLLKFQVQSSKFKVQNENSKNLELGTWNLELISKATIFLLKSKDRYGVWYSTQTTINVLDAFLASLSESKNQTISISMNGEKLKDLAISSDQIEPFVLDLSGKLLNVNRLEITSSDDSTLMAQVVSTHYIDWENSEISNQNTNQSRQLRLDYKCDKLAAKIMDEITCAVEAERIGFQGYGMLLAEIGLPPGADVSRESLEKAFDADWSLSRYDVLPDKIIIYMWSKAGGTRFNFKFKPRYGIKAQTPASVVYDYYNPEAQAMVAPLRFEVK